MKLFISLFSISHERIKNKKFSLNLRISFQTQIEMMYIWNTIPTIWNSKSFPSPSKTTFLGWSGHWLDKKGVLFQQLNTVIIVTKLFIYQILTKLKYYQILIWKKADSKKKKQIQIYTIWSRAEKFEIFI